MASRLRPQSAAIVARTCSQNCRKSQGFSTAGAPRHSKMSSAKKHRAASAHTQSSTVASRRSDGSAVAEPPGRSLWKRARRKPCASRATVTPFDATTRQWRPSGRGTTSQPSSPPPLPADRSDGTVVIHSGRWIILEKRRTPRMWGPARRTWRAPHGKGDAGGAWRLALGTATAESTMAESAASPVTDVAQSIADSSALSSALSPSAVAESRALI